MLPRVADETARRTSRYRGFFFMAGPSAMPMSRQRQVRVSSHSSLPSLLLLQRAHGVDA